MNRFFPGIIIIAALFCLSGLTGCIAIPGIVQDERGVGTQYDDASIKTSIVSSLLKKDVSKANDLNVHCFRGQVFLVGEADQEFRAIALETAQNATGVVHVTTHWFPTGTASTVNDTALEANIDGKLLFTKNVSSTQVVVDVWGGHVVLSGIMADQGDIDRTVKVVQGITSVKSVTSYLVTS